MDVHANLCHIIIRFSWDNLEYDWEPVQLPGAKENGLVQYKSGSSLWMESVRLFEEQGTSFMRPKESLEKGMAVWGGCSKR